MNRFMEALKAIVLHPRVIWWDKDELQPLPKCAACGTHVIGEKEADYHENCDFCEGHGGGFVMGCECNAGIDVMALQAAINRLRSEVLDDLISAGKKAAAEAETEKGKSVRPDVEPVVEEAEQHAEKEATAEGGGVGDVSSGVPGMHWAPERPPISFGGGVEHRQFYGCKCGLK